MNIRINGELVPEKESAKYLGIILDNRLSWESHIKQAKMKLQRGLGIMRKLKPFVPNKTLKTAFYSFIIPHVDYGLINWGNASKQNLAPIKKCIAKATNFLKEHKDSNILHQYLSFENMYNLSVGKFMWQLINNKLPLAINNSFTKKRK